MDPVSTITLSIAVGAAAIAGKELVSAAVKDAYQGLKNQIRSRYPKVSLDRLEQAPGSKEEQDAVEKGLAASKAGQDTELMVAARALITLAQRHAPSAAASLMPADEETLSLYLILMSTGERFKIHVLVNMSVGALKEQILENIVRPRNSGFLMRRSFLTNRTGAARIILQDEMTLAESGTQNGDTLSFFFEADAG
jgi:hypothetical protein